MQSPNRHSLRCSVFFLKPAILHVQVVGHFVPAQPDHSDQRLQRGLRWAKEPNLEKAAHHALLDLAPRSEAIGENTPDLLRQPCARVLAGLQACVAPDGLAKQERMGTELQAFDGLAKQERMSTEVQNRRAS